MQVALGTPLKQANATGQKRRGRERKRQRPADRSAYLSAHAPPCTHRQAKDSPVPIPNIRRLQARGVSFLNHYVNVVSSTPCFLFSKHRLLSYAHTRTHAHTHSHTLTLSNIRTLCFGCLPAAANLLSVASLNVERQAAAQHSTQPQSVHAFPCFVTPLLRALPLQWRPSARKTCFPQARLLPCRAPLLASSLPSTQRPCLSLSIHTPAPRQHHRWRRMEQLRGRGRQRIRPWRHRGRPLSRAPRTKRLRYTAAGQDRLGQRRAQPDHNVSAPRSAFAGLFFTAALSSLYHLPSQG